MTETFSLEDVISENMSFVYGVCKRYSNYADKEDLYQVGAMGLINAYNNFDKSQNVKFSTYAFPYIVGEVNKYLRENRNIKYSRDMVRLGKKLNEYILKHKEVKGFEPSVKDMSLCFDISPDKILLALDASKASKSLDEEIISDGKALTLLDVTPDEKSPQKDDLLALKQALSVLTKEEKKLVIERYFNNLTQQDVADILGVNQVYVSRMEQKVL